MIVKNIAPHASISLFVKDILWFEETGNPGKTVLPFFADGFPGIMYQQTENGLMVNPHNKQMPLFFIYGQTIKPIELVLTGNYRLIVFQLYPFVLKSFFNVQPKQINDGCYNLAQLPGEEAHRTLQLLTAHPGAENSITAISDFLCANFESKCEQLDFKVRQAIQLILDSNGLYPINKLAAVLNITERTLERRFLKEVGVSPKQFSKLIQFQQSLTRLTGKDYSKLTDIVYTNGFADQSHFIKVFKAFTGKTPNQFRATMSSNK